MKIYEAVATTDGEFYAAVQAAYDELVSHAADCSNITRFEAIAPHRDGGMIYRAFAHPEVGEALSAVVIDRS